MADEPTKLPGFRRAAEFDEQERWTRLDSGVRVYVNAPLALQRAERRLVIYATPNGNSIEQTLGCAMVEGRDWHFDIQHVAAQTRKLRAVSPDEDVLLAVVQAPQLSWPAFRQTETKAGETIRGLVDSLAKELDANRVVLSGHSGGGSFIFGYLNSVAAIPSWIDRIVFLDANYAYSDEEKHGDKLLRWLRDDTNRHLVVVAYDDREITLNGKQVVSPTGGTFRASQRMMDRLFKEGWSSAWKREPFERYTGPNGQIEFFIHPNSQNKILHTALVGEMNGLLLGLSVGTDRIRVWNAFAPERAYTDWIQRQPADELKVSSPAEPRAARPAYPLPKLNLPPRPNDALSGSEFFLKIQPLSRDEREAAILQQITSGNIPQFLRSLRQIDVEATDSAGVKHTASYFVMPDYLAVGGETDFFRLPMTPMTAQKIAAAADASLITTKISDDLFQQAELKLQPQPLTKDREAAATFFQHHNLIESQRDKPLGLLIVGIKKDVVLTNRLQEKPNRVAIYGWHHPDGKPIQPLYVGHVDWYVDYSHGIRLMSQQMIVDGQPRRVDDVLNDKQLSILLSNEGPIEARY